MVQTQVTAFEPCAMSGCLPHSTSLGAKAHIALQLLRRGEVAWACLIEFPAMGECLFARLRAGDHDERRADFRQEDAGDVDPPAYEPVTRRLDLATDRGAVITDEHNPIDVARIRTALVWQTQTLAQFGRLRLRRF